MRLAFQRVAVGAGAIGLMIWATLAWAVSPAGAVPASAVNWTCFNSPGAGCPAASFNGYATGAELYLGALEGSSTQVADLEQGFSGASTASSGLDHVIDSETGALVQPAEPASVKSYATGSGFELGVDTATIPTSDTNQVQVAGRFEQTAPPDTSAPAKTIGPVSLPPVAEASTLTGDGDAVYNNAVCPIGQPLSYGIGDAEDAGALYSGSTPLLSTAGTAPGTTPTAPPDTSVAQSTSQTYLHSNGDGTFGLSTQASDIIAPITVNLPGGVSLRVAVQSAGGVDSPVSLTATTTGEASGASIKFSTDDLLTVTLVTSSGSTTLVSLPLDEVAPGGLQIPLSTDAIDQLPTLAGDVPGVGSTLKSVLQSGPVATLLDTVDATAKDVASGTTVSLGYIDIDTTPHVIGQPATDFATAVGGTAASGAIDLLHLHLALTSSLVPTADTLPTLADFYVGHLESAATQSAPIVCNLPVIKTANPTSVQAGQSFTYNIEVPNPADLGLIDCNLDDINVTDVITDQTGDPSFEVTSAVDTATNQPGTIDQISPNRATVTWTGLSYQIASPPNAPIPLSIAVSVPATSPSGVITDTVTADAVTGNCQGGAEASAAAAAGGAGAALTGAYTLDQPAVTVAPAAAPPSGAPAPHAQLPFTGAMGGLWQPIGGLAALGVGSAALMGLRRARRLRG